MYRVRKKIRFEMSHRLRNSWTEACQKIHGHSYVAEIIISASKLNQDGMIIDFGQLKEVLMKYVQRMDHAVALHVEDPLTKIFEETQKLVAFEFNPTAENMARDFCEYLIEEMPQDCEMDSIAVRLHETETGWAEYEVKFN